MKPVKSGESESYEKGLRELGFFAFRKGDLTAHHNCLKGDCSQVGVSLISQTAGDKRTQPPAAPWEVQIRHQENSFPERVVKHWNGPPRKVLESPSLEAFKEQLGVALSATA
ncbi:hypothetical protein DUI87_09119 [Hirundo rustica rustica]|uniref:Uncharacterized protein n=1 Tax=Hirundo rustica rustica TaxID=333673 RepID=A0A3M0KLA8_HIRRU|nr:hypothetical protein DUI87_09119 [Hirundo rustica rustica]